MNTTRTRTIASILLVTTVVLSTMVVPALSAPATLSESGDEASPAGEATATFTVANDGSQDQTSSVSEDAEGTYSVGADVLDASGVQDTTTAVDTVGGALEADAGINVITSGGSTVVLNGSRSSDPDGDTLSYSWTQIGGPAVTLSGGDTATPSFVAPTVDNSRTLTFELTVSNGTTSATDTVSVTVQPEGSTTGPIVISNCTTLDDAGTYELTGNVAGPSDGPCIEITASDVTFDGNGYDINGGDLVANGTTNLTNVTVRDIILNQEPPISKAIPNMRLTGVSDSRVEDVSIYLAGSESAAMIITGDNNTVTGRIGVPITFVTGENNRVVDATLSSIEVGPLSVDGDGTLIRNITASSIYPSDISGADNRVVNSSFAGMGSGLLVRNASGIVFVNNTASGVRFKNTTNASIRRNTLSFSAGLVLANSSGATVANNSVVESADEVAIELSESDSNTFYGNSIEGRIGLYAGSESNVIYNNRIIANDSAISTAAGADPSSNTWNVSARPGENIVGGDRLGGNYYAVPNGSGFSQTCEDADGDGICDSPNRLAENNTDYLPLADPVTEPGETDDFQVTGLQAPTTVPQGETVTVNATITNTGDSAGTQTVAFRIDLDEDGVAEPIGVNESVTLAPDASQVVSFDIPTSEIEPGTYTHGIFTEDDSATAELTVEPSRTATVTFDNQTSDGTTVVVESVTMSEGGFVAVHNSSLLEGDATGSVIGVSDYLSVGTHENVTVSLFNVPGAGFSGEAALEENQTLIAMPHLDTNGNETYDFVTTAGEADGAYTTDSGAVVDDAYVSVETDEPAPEETHYQVDFVAGEPLENLSADTLYAQQDRLVRFALGSTDDGITDRGRAWASADVRSCIDSAGVVKQSNATAMLTFTVKESCTNATMSFVSYTKPTAGFSPETASQQELFEATTETFGPGTHTITVGLPETNTNGTAETESVAPL